MALYAPFQALGLVCDGAVDGCAPALHRQGLSSFLTTPVDGGRTLHLYDIKLHLKGVSKPIPSSWVSDRTSDKFSHIAAAQELTFASIGPAVCVFRRLQPYTLWTNHDEPVALLSTVGNILVSIATDGRLIAWTFPASAKDAPEMEGTVICDIALPTDFTTTCLAHPQTYMNKILLGGSDGRCLLLNLKTRKIVHTFPGYGPGVTVLEPSPALDVVAVGTDDGHIYLHNFRVDETVAKFRHGEFDASSRDMTDSDNPSQRVAAISFRTDGNESMVSSDADGNMFVWDLNDRTLTAEARKVHPGGTSMTSFLPGEPILITAGVSDNAVKVHLFDEANGQARLLRSREGHQQPPTMVRFCGYDGFMMVSTGLDRELRLVSAIHEARNRSFAQKSVAKKGKKSKKRRRVEAKIEIGDRSREMTKKLPEVIDIATGNTRQRDEDFANIVTIHVGRQEAYTWRLQNGASHEHVLRPPGGPQEIQLSHVVNKTQTHLKKPVVKADYEDKNPTCVVMSPCGNYAMIGSKDGRIHSYNLQSGRHQGAYSFARKDESDGKNAANTVDERSTWGRAHSCAVTGLSTDGCGDVLVSAGSTDREIRFWNLHRRDFTGNSISALSRVCRLAWCVTSDLLAVACEDFCIYVYDASTRKLARKFKGHHGPIVDFCFDTEGRRIISASLDSSLRTWDLPTGSLVNTLRCQGTPTSVTVAPQGDYIATTHVNSLGIQLWVDQSKFGVPAISTGQNSAEFDKTGVSDDENTEAGSQHESEDDSIPPDLLARTTGKGQSLLWVPLSDEIVTLSSKPTSHWTVLSNLQAIKERNKPIDPPKKPVSAPFFLPTVKGLKMEFDTNVVKEDGGEPKKAGEGKMNMETDAEAAGDLDEWGNSTFGKLVASGKFDEAASLLRDMDASGVDMEIRTVAGAKSRSGAVAYFNERLSISSDFELTQAHLSVFLSSQGADLARDDGGADLLGELTKSQEKAWEKLRTTFDTVLSLSAYFSGQV